MNIEPLKNLTVPHKGRTDENRALLNINNNLPEPVDTFASSKACGEEALSLGRAGKILSQKAAVTPVIKKIISSDSDYYGSPVIMSDSTILCRNGIVGNEKVVAYTPQGDVKWEIPHASQGTPDLIIDKNDNIYMSQPGCFSSYDKNGVKRWVISSYDFSDAVHRHLTRVFGESLPAYECGPRGYAALSPDGGTVYTDFNERCFSAVDSQTGKIKWTRYFEGSFYVTSEPYVDEKGNIFVHTSDGALHGMKPDGTLLFSKKFGEDYEVTSKVLPSGEGLLLVPLNSGRLVEIKSENGEIVNELKIKGRVWNPKKMSDGRIAFMTYDPFTLNVARKNKDTGRLELIWTKEVGKYSAGPLHVDNYDRIYIEDACKKIKVFNSEGSTACEINYKPAHRIVVFGKNEIVFLSKTNLIFTEIPSKTSNLEDFDCSGEKKKIINRKETVSIGGVCLEKRKKQGAG